MTDIDDGLRADPQYAGLHSRQTPFREATPQLRPFVKERFTELEEGKEYVLCYREDPQERRGTFKLAGVKSNATAMRIVEITTPEGRPDCVALDDLWLEGIPGEPELTSAQDMTLQPLYLVVEKAGATWPARHQA